MLNGLISVQVNEERENSQRSLFSIDSDQPPNTIIEFRIFIFKSKLNVRALGEDLVGGMKVMLKASANIKHTFR